MILGVGLVSLATLFPIGLLRLREAQRQTRSAYLGRVGRRRRGGAGTAQQLTRSSTPTCSTRPLRAWYFFWYISPTFGRFNPLTQDTAYTADPYDTSAATPAHSSTRRLRPALRL